MLAITPPEDAFELHMNLIATAARSAGPPARGAPIARCGECASTRKTKA